MIDVAMADAQPPARDASGLPRAIRVTREDEAHDVLAAEEFGVPASDPRLHHGPVRLPEDPTGIAEPHDVLAAEEFALPAPRIGNPAAARSDAARGRRLAILAAAALAVVLIRRLRGR